MTVTPTKPSAAPYAPSAIEPKRVPLPSTPLSGPGRVARVALGAMVLTRGAATVHLLAVNFLLHRAIVEHRMAEAQGQVGPMITRAGVLMATAEITTVIAMMAGLVWLYRAWRLAPQLAERSPPRPLAKRTSPAAVVAWTLVPIVGAWKARGFLTDLAEANRIEDGASVDFTCLAVVTFFAVRIASQMSLDLYFRWRVLTIIVAFVAFRLCARMSRRFELTYAARAQAHAKKIDEEREASVPVV